jgi:hypothetical protein
MNPYLNDKNRNHGRPDPILGAQDDLSAAGKEGEKQVAIDGFAQVLEMLKIADPEFRESLLKRLASRDPELARTLRTKL